MNCDRHVRAYRRAWKRITEGACCRLSDRKLTTAKAMARDESRARLVAEARKRGRTGRPNVEGGVHKRPRTAPTFAVVREFPKARA